MFDLYIRVSKLGEPSEGEATEVYEAQCRAWADRARVAIDEVAEETDVSGATAVAERKLERLIQRVKSSSGREDRRLVPRSDRGTISASSWRGENDLRPRLLFDRR